jgi:catechol 2,3-dioxygenase
MSTRLPDRTRLGPVRLQVADLGRSIEYYERVIGLRVAGRGTDSATLAAHGGPVLVELHERRGAEPVPRRGRLGLYHFAILVPERAALGRFVSHLAEHGVPAGMSDHLVSEAIYLTDPDGLGIEVYADRPRSEWRRDGGQIAMATDPLDAANLVAAAGGEPWTGMPAGTAIGHVHLHVGDLDAAEAFYHRGIGFDRTVWSYPGALFLSAGGYHHHLGTNTWARGAAPAGESDARLLEWTIAVPGSSAVDGIERSVAAAGYATAKDGGDVLLTDPWGTRVRVTTDQGGPGT